MLADEEEGPGVNVEVTWSKKQSSLWRTSFWPGLSLGCFVVGGCVSGV